MKNKKKYLFIVIIMMCFINMSCKREDKTQNIKPIETVLTTYKNNSEVKDLEGVIYAMQNDGFYICDSEKGRIFVTNPSEGFSLTIGDKVKVSGRYLLNNDTETIPHIVNTTFKKLSSSNETIQSITDSSVIRINNIVNDSKNGSYGLICKITITVSKNEEGIYHLKDDEANAIILDCASNYQTIDKFNNKRITLPVIIHAYSTEYSKMIVSFTGTYDDIVINPLPISELKDFAINDITKRVPKEISEDIELPSVHSYINYLTYNWSVDQNEVISIDEKGKLIINIDKYNYNIDLNVTISNEVSEESIIYTIVLKVYDSVIDDAFRNMVNGKEVYLTCVGQADIGTVQAILKKIKKTDETALEANKDYNMDSLQDPSKVTEGSTVILVIGASGKGLGASGTDINKEITRAEAFADLANQNKIKLIAIHVGGASRRGSSTDKLIKIVCQKADLTMVVYTGNTDKIFDDNSLGNLYEFTSSAKMVDSFSKIFGLLN